MKLLKPSWVHHDDKPVFSVDVHQECEKFATGGQGMDSGLVVIWNLLPVLSEAVEMDEKVPKLLCQMDDHLACVNSVRWSQNGQMLASGSDDKLVMIWRQKKGVSEIFGTGGRQTNPESWKCVHTLRGHSGDVLDLAWSPQDNWLASCSIDNTIIIWDVQQMPTIVAVLRGHTGLVKGVTWDPVGKYLASQSDDRSVKIWKTSDWCCGSTIKEPFEECGGTTHILRLSWSPDGQYLVSAHAMNGGGPTAQIIEREGWKCDKDFVGHRKAVTCVRFHNAILKGQGVKASKPQQYCCLAVGSRDRSLSVWLTALQRPLVVVHDLFDDSVLDLSWGARERLLLACSGDGTVACLQFKESELGTPLSDDDKNSLYQRIYGRSVGLQNGADNPGSDFLIENPELLNATAAKFQPPTLPNPMGATPHSQNSIIATPAPLPANGFAMCDTQTRPTESTQFSRVADNAPPTKVVISKQLETRTADGRRRITPVFIPPTKEPSDVPQPQAPPVIARPLSPEALPLPLLPQALTSTDTLQDIKPVFLKALDPLISTAEKARLDTRLAKSTKAPPLTFKTDPEELRSFPNSRPSESSLQNPTHQANSCAPKMRITLNRKCEFFKAALDFRVHVSNCSVDTPAGPLSKVAAFQVSCAETLWTTYVGSAVSNFNFCDKYIMICCLDTSLRLLDMRTGVALLPIMTLTTNVSQCAFSPSGALVGVVTEEGVLRIWDVKNQRVSLSTTCSEVLGKFGSIWQFSITEQGLPLIAFANGCSYSYSNQLQSWLTVNTNDPIMRYGLQTTMPKDLPTNARLYPLLSSQLNTHSFAKNAFMLEVGNQEWHAVGKVSFIENQIKLSEAISSPDELRYWYAMLAYHLILGSNEKRLRLILDDLLGTIEGMPTPETLQTRRIMTVLKSELFENVLALLRVNGKWQRLYMEYQELYQSCKDGSLTNFSTNRNTTGANEKDGPVQKRSRHSFTTDDV